MRPAAPTLLLNRVPRARRHLGLAVTAGTLAGLCTIGQAWWLAKGIDAAFLAGLDLVGVAPWLGGLAALAGGRAALTWGGEVAAQRAAAAAKADLRLLASRRLLARGPLAMGSERTGEIISTLVPGVDTLDAYLAQYLPQAALAMIVPVTVLVAVASTDLLSAAVLAVTFPLIPLFMYVLGGVARERARRQWLTLSRLSARFFDAIEALPSARAFGATSRELGVIADGSERFRRVTMEVLRVAFLSALVLELLATIGTAIVAVQVGLRLLYARLPFLDAFFVLLLAPEFYRPLRALGAAWHAGMAGREASPRILELVSPVHEQAGPVAGTSLRDRRAGLQPGPPSVAFDGVSFAYRAGGPRALDDVSFVVPAGETVALVGPSGSGKSTCAALLLGFARPARGRILIDGHDLARLDPHEWRRLIAWVPQRPYLFHGTVADNLRLVRPDATAAEIEHALARAAALAFVRELPRGLDTPIGERGQALSGGQAQRIALARAFLADAPLLVLDEPTSQLDPWTEPEVTAALRDLRRHRTVVLLAHRFSLVAAADRVVLLSGGRVAASGPPATLAHTSPTFHRMARLAAGETP